MKVSLINQKSDAEFTSLFYSSHTETEFAYSLGFYNFGGGAFSARKKHRDQLGLDRKSQWHGALKRPDGHFFLTSEEYFAINTSRTGKSPAEGSSRKSYCLIVVQFVGIPANGRGRSWPWKWIISMGITSTTASKISAFFAPIVTP